MIVHSRLFRYSLIGFFRVEQEKRLGMLEM